MKLIKTLTLLLLSGMFLTSCQKEYSEENGGAGSVATGTLKAAGTGECLPSSVHGNFIAGTALTATHYINVDVNITTAGAYTITSDIVNGYSFSASGVVTSTGVQTIKLAASGTPTAAGANTFTVKFGTSQCNIVVDVYPGGTGNAVLTLGGAPGNCTVATLAGTYTQGTAMNSSNTATVEVTATTAGFYNITSLVVNGVTFSGSGYVATGTHTVVLTASGTPTAAGLKTHAVNISTSSSTATACSFDVTYAVATTPPVGGFTWSFKVGTTTYSGTCDDAVVMTTPMNFVTITGNATTGSGTISIVLTNMGGAITTGDYLTSAMTGKFAAFTYTDGTENFMAAPTMGNMTIKLTGFSAATDAVGTFSGTAKSGADPTTGPSVTITNGTFKANLP